MSPDRLRGPRHLTALAATILLGLTLSRCAELVAGSSAYNSACYRISYSEPPQVGNCDGTGRINIQSPSACKAAGDTLGISYFGTGSDGFAPPWCYMNLNLVHYNTYDSTSTRWPQTPVSGIPTICRVDSCPLDFHCQDGLLETENLATCNGFVAQLNAQLGHAGGDFYCHQWQYDESGGTFRFWPRISLASHNCTRDSALLSSSIGVTVACTQAYMSCENGACQDTDDILLGTGQGTCRTDNAAVNDWIAGLTWSPTTSDPTSSPTISVPTPAPTVSPVTSEPTAAPTYLPTTSHPTRGAPVTSQPTSDPTPAPTVSPTTSEPTSAPTDLPTTSDPTRDPTAAPVTSEPTQGPSLSPSQSPTTSSPTATPSPRPTTYAPTAVMPPSKIEVTLPGNLNDLTAAEKDELRSALATEAVSRTVTSQPATAGRLTADDITVTLTSGSIVATIEFPPIREFDIQALVVDVNTTSITVTIAGGKQFTSTTVAIASSPQPAKEEESSAAAVVAVVVAAVVVVLAAAVAALCHSKKGDGRRQSTVAPVSHSDPPADQIQAQDPLSVALDHVLGDDNNGNVEA